tara:strand:+ start:505 stop:789 length:285 start_codon:yes stop_codon:yes gene_type:complete
MPGRCSNFHAVAFSCGVAMPILITPVLPPVVPYLLLVPVMAAHLYCSRAEGYGGRRPISSPYNFFLSGWILCALYMPEFGVLGMQDDQQPTPCL